MDAVILVKVDATESGNPLDLTVNSYVYLEVLHLPVLLAVVCNDLLDCPLRL